MEKISEQINDTHEKNNAFAMEFISCLNEIKQKITEEDVIKFANEKVLPNMRIFFIELDEETKTIAAAIDKLSDEQVEVIMKNHDKYRNLSYYHWIYEIFRSQVTLTGDIRRYNPV